MAKGKSYSDISIYISSETNHCIILYLLAAVSLIMSKYYWKYDWAGCKEQYTSRSLSLSEDESNTFPVSPSSYHPYQHTGTIYQH